MPGSDPPLISLMVSVDVKQHVYLLEVIELRSCVKAEVVVLGSPSLISLMVFVDVKHQERKKKKENWNSNSKTVILKHSSVRSIWTSLTAS